MFLEILYYLTIRPLEILFETIFFISYRFIGKPFATIIALSIFVNILVLPLYKRADKLQAEQREREKAMEGRLSHIKKTFKGDERVMMTQAYYRICDYKPVYALRGASSLLLQIPFFIAAFRFLSGLEMIKGMPSILLPLSLTGGVPTYLIKDLGAPDAMFTVHGMAVNVLPMLMTLINIVSGTIYSKGHLRKEKVQLYVTALVFLVLLYNSPAGLVMYWTCNNIFSLCKNAVQKIFEGKKRKAVKEISAEPDRSALKNGSRVYDRLFLFCATLMALMTGLFIPSNVISSSALEFITSFDVFNPARYLVYSFALAIGFYVIWAGVYYFFSTGRVRRIFSLVAASLCICTVADYMMSGSGLGTLSADLEYDVIPSFDLKFVIINALLVAALIALTAFVVGKKPMPAGSVAMAGCLAVLGASFVNIHHINTEYGKYIEIHSGSDAYDVMPEIKLSRTGKNVVVIMVDRAIGSLVPYILNERPDLMNSFDGFTYYHDTVSYGESTNFGMPPVFGGYEYTPYEMNKRDDELLADKNDEALKVLPVLFYENGYDVSVMDPPYAGYKWTPDLSIYDDYPGMNVSISQYKLNAGSDDEWKVRLRRRKRNLFCFSFMKSMPLFLQNTLYDDGDYYFRFLRINASDMAAVQNADQADEDDRNRIGVLTSSGYNSEFMSWYSVLDNLDDITSINEDGKGGFTMLYNCMPHEATLLQLPDYEPELQVDNTAFDVTGYYTINGITMHLNDEFRVKHYHVNMATFLRLGEWLEYLKAEGVYDNTRIIIVSDHGRGIGCFDGFNFGEDHIPTDTFLPLLLVKDFDEHGFKFSNELMTNADACIMAVSGDVVEEAVNPFTGNKLDGHQKYEDPIMIIKSEEFDVDTNNGTKFLPGDWYELTGTPYESDNWQYVGHF